MQRTLNTVITGQLHTCMISDPPALIQYSAHDEVQVLANLCLTMCACWGTIIIDDIQMGGGGGGGGGGSMQISLSI